ncbi:MAG TPA: AAA family ATPase [Candidatus Deferrimicrobium sp.]|nr:AAA family ATPase [Candidatus Deferrimicrobium sp.]
MLVSILSGKGGVGKTVIACNLAERLASAGLRVLLVDADFNFGNVHVLCNVTAEHGVNDFASGRLTLSQARVTLTESFDVLTSEGGELTDAFASVKQAIDFLKRLRQQGADYDLILLDHSSGKSETAAAVALASDLAVLVVVPELTSLSDAYGLFKHLTHKSSKANIGLLINRAESVGEAENLCAKFIAVTNEFLGRVPRCLGSLPEDPAVKESVSRQQLLAQTAPDAPMLRALDDLGSAVIDKVRSEAPVTGEGRRAVINENRIMTDTRG